MLDMPTRVGSVSLLETSKPRQFQNCARDGYNAAILQRNIETLDRVKKSLFRLMADRDELKILITPSDDRVRIPQTSNLDESLQQEFDAMLDFSRHTAGNAVKHFIIQKAFFRSSHTHHFSVVNSNWESEGTGFETTNGLISAKEGDWAYIGAGVPHTSQPETRPQKTTVFCINA